jgi:nitrate reductase gamma subunit
MNMLLWVIIPYLCLAGFVGGLFWRRRYGTMGWTTRSSQLYEGTVLRWGSPLFHFGVIAVVFGHVGGLLIPASWTRAVGVSEHLYHLSAVLLGTVSGTCTAFGLGLLLARRLRVRPVFAATTGNDKAMYAVLAAVILLGLTGTLTANVTGDGYDYRQTISPWFRSLLYLHPDPNLMASVPLALKLHVLAAVALFAFWPFTRLVHAFSAPVGYLTRPYIVYRSRDTRAGRPDSRRGWQPVVAPTTQRKRLPKH